jgi:hypothetical protein
VKNIGFTGVLRLVFKPLVAELPCFGAVCCSLREKVSQFSFRSNAPQNDSSRLHDLINFTAEQGGIYPQGHWWRNDCYSRNF